MITSQPYTQQGGLVTEGFLQEKDSDKPRRIGQFGQGEPGGQGLHEQSKVWTRPGMSVKRMAHP